MLRESIKDNNFNLLDFDDLDQNNYDFLNVWKWNNIKHFRKIKIRKFEKNFYK